jgi:diguanylate cyclase (GGDEF)-like protein
MVGQEEIVEAPEKKLRILLVDDDEEEYLLVQALLSDRSYRPSSADYTHYRLEWVGTYEEALAEIRKKQHDVYLIDYQLGVHTGLQLIRETASSGVSAPVILMTGHGSYDLDVKAMRIGATDYLSKEELTPALLERSIRYAIESKRAEEEIRTSAERSMLLAHLSHAFAEAGLEYPEIVNEIARNVSAELEDVCFIFIQKDKFFTVQHHRSSLKNKAAQLMKQLQQMRGLPRLLWGAEPLLLNHLSEHLSSSFSELELEPVDLQTFGSLLTVPLLVRGNLIGNLGSLRTSSQPAHTEQDVRFFNSLGDHASLAIDNARLYASAQQRARELNALHQATSALLSTLDLDELLGQILDAAQSALPAADRGIIFLVAPGTGRLQLRAAQGFKDPRIQKMIFPKGSDYPARVLLEKKPMLIYDLAAEVDRPEDLNFRSALAVPLIHGAVVHGVLFLSAAAPRAFTSQDLHLLESFAATTTAALQNAFLHAEVQKLAVTDSLTGFLNRRGFDEISAREFERSRRFGRPLAAVMIDIDHFKDINDTYGHAAGDRVLIQLADRLQETLREVDILGRYGGDEFIILLPESEQEIAAAVAERIHESLARPFSLAGPGKEGASLNVSASFGVAAMTQDINDISALIHLADEASYRAKQQGRNRVEVA